MKKEIGYIGLGKMGFAMAERLLEKGYAVHAYDPNIEFAKQIEEKGAVALESLKALIAGLSVPRVVWVMVPAQAVAGVIQELLTILSPGDTIIDGGNTKYTETVESGALVQSRGIHFLDVGVSGGPRGAREGACLMVGGERDEYEKHADLFRDLSAPDAYAYLGKCGAGHFTKMVHNGIEYGMMQAIAEGFAVLKQSEFDISLSEAVRIYGNQSVISSRLIDWLREGYKTYGEELAEISGTVGGTGEGAWTVEVGQKLQVPTPVIEASVHFREKSKENPSYTGKVLSTLRNQFGGHHAK